MTPRCACRPSCLSVLHPTDNTVPTDAGLVLTAHAQAAPYPTEGLTSLVSPLSKVHAR